MGLFSRNPNEVHYAGGKKHWADVIKNTGEGNLLIWRQPEEDFNTNSTLIVMPGETAIFVHGGTVEQVFENGTYRLSTENYPFISRLRNAFTGGISTFNCVVYFVKSADSREIRWGTDSPIQVRDKVYGVRTAARVRAAYRVRVVNPVQFLQKMVGSNVNAQGLGDLSDYFAGEFQGRIKSAVSRYLNSLEQELIGLDAYMDEISGQIMPYIDEALSEYGLKCVRFTLAGLDIDTSKYDRLDESQMRMITNQRGVMSQRAELDTLGPDWGRVQGAGLLRDIVNHPGAAMGAGMGVGLGAAGAVGTIARQVFAPAADGYPPQHAAGASTFAGSPNHPAAGANGFAGSPPRPGVTASGSAGAPASSDRVARLRELKMMLDEGLIEPAEYDAAKADILREMRG